MLGNGEVTLLSKIGVDCFGLRIGITLDLLLDMGGYRVSLRNGGADSLDLIVKTCYF